MRILISKRRKGVALILTLFFMILLYAIASSYYMMVPAEMRSAIRIQDDAEAFYAADSGVSDAIAQMENQIHTNHAAFEDLSSSSTFWVKESSGRALPALATFPSTAFSSSSNARQLLAARSYSNQLSDRLSYDVLLERWAFKQDGQRVPDGYRIVSQAIRDRGAATQKIRRTVVSWCIQKNFSNYAYFVDRLPQAIWLDLNTFRIEGPYHTNDEVLVSAPSNWNDGRGSSFLSQLSMPQNKAYKDTNLNKVVDGIHWYNYTASGLPYNSTSGAIDATRYQRVVDGGVGRVHQTAGPITLPSDSGNLQTAAYGGSVSGVLSSADSTSTFGKNAAVQLHAPKTTGGSYPALKAGLYLEGDIDQITLSAQSASDGNASSSDGNTNGVMEIQQSIKIGSVTKVYSANVTTVYESLTVPTGAYINGSSTATTGPTILNFSSNSLGYTVVREGTTNNYSVYEGVGNGAVFINGDVDGLRGVNRGRKTIATAMDSGNQTAKDKKIWINGDITRADTPIEDPVTHKNTGTNPVGVRDQLGLVSYAVRMKRDDVATNPFFPKRVDTGLTKPILIYAAIFAGRNNDPHDGNQLTGGGMGTDNYNSGTSGHFSLFGSLTEGTRQVKGTFGGGGGTGYSYEYHYDKNFSATAPPFFPGTSGFRMASWTEDAVRSQ